MKYCTLRLFSYAEIPVPKSRPLGWKIIILYTG